MGMPLFNVYSNCVGYTEYVVRNIRRTIVVNGALLVASLRTPSPPPRSHAGRKFGLLVPAVRIH